jgi:hypothetical protein
MCRLAIPWHRVDASRSVPKDFLVDLLVGELLRPLALAGQILVDVVLVRGDRGAREQEAEVDRWLTGGGEGNDPAGLAVPGESDAGPVDLRLSGEEPRGGLRVARENVDRGRRRRLARVLPPGLAGSAFVVGEHRNAVPHEQCLQVG